MNYRLLSLLSLTFLPSVATAQRDLKEIPIPDPELERQTFQLPDGFQANLWAADPLNAKPIQMAWDEKGRLWVASSAIYPHIAPGQEQADKIVVLEDTDHDGKADKSTVFFEGLLIPTGILPGDGGAYVANSTELLFMKDTDGDGRADETKVLLSGFGTEDTHHILHSIKRGPDGFLYFNQSVYIHSHIETPWGVRRLLGSGIWQYATETGRLEVFTMGQINPWGHVFDRWGQSFTTDGAYGEGINYAFPGATYRCLPDQRPRILTGLNPGQPKQAGLAVISGRHFPDEWQGDLITCDFRGHRVNRFKVADNDSGFSSRQLGDVVASDHPAFRPVDVRMGPDGGLYLADWYNPIIQHGEVDFRDERRDHEHGRIWRITAKDRPLCPQPEYAKLSTDALLELLKAPEQWVRLEAKQELKTRQGAGEAITAWAAKQNHEPAALTEALWAAQTARSDADKTLFATLVRHESADARAAAVRWAGLAARDGRLGLDAFAFTTTDENPRVRLEAVNALRTAGTAAAVELALTALDKPLDTNLDFALWLTCQDLADTWLPAFQKGEISFGADAGRIAFALKAADRPGAIGALLTLLEEGKIDESRASTAIGVVGSLGDAAMLGRLLTIADSHKGAVDLHDAVFAALSAAEAQRKVRADSGLPVILNRLTGEKASVAAMRLAGSYQLEDARSALESAAKNAGETGDAALSALVALGGEKTRAVLTAMAADKATRPQALPALAALDAAAAAPAVAAFLASGADEAAANRLYAVYLSRADGPALLATALTGKTLPGPIAAAGVQRASATGGDTKGLIDVLTAAGGLKPVMSLTPDEVAAMVAEVRTQGSAARGEAIYRRQTMACQTCHAIGAAGGVIGPDLVSIGSSAPVDYIIDSLLEPSKKIKEGYATTVVNTKDGGVFTGFLAREDAREVILRDAAGTLQSIPADNVTSRQSVPVSLMPPGLTASLRRDEFVDLVRFLSDLGREGAGKVAPPEVVRTWEALTQTDVLPQLMNRDGYRALTGDVEGVVWQPLYGQVHGDLPLAEIPVINAWQVHGSTVRCAIEVSGAAGKVGLRIADPVGLRLWIDGADLPIAPEITTDLAPGRHRLTIAIDPARRQAPLRLEVVPVPGSPASVRPVAGASLR